MLCICYSTTYAQELEVEAIKFPAIKGFGGGDRRTGFDRRKAKRETRRITRAGDVETRYREVAAIKAGALDKRVRHAKFDENGRLIWYQRWNFQHRIQHLTLMVSFGGLVLTGFPLKFAESPASKILMMMMGGVKGAGLLHRFCGILLIFLSVYHVVWLIMEYAKGKRSTAMLPRARDFKDVADNFAYFLGIKRSPRFARYNYIEKFEYFAVAWGNSVMILTGLALWFPVFAQHHLPEWVFPLSLMLHDYEALLAALAIILWHLFNVHIHPTAYPQNPVWLTGKMSRKMMAHHHGEELAEIEAAYRTALAMVKTEVDAGPGSDSETQSLKDVLPDELVEDDKDE